MRTRAYDWANTPLGPVEGWTERLKGAVEQMLAAPQMASIAVGPERIFLYNDKAAKLYGARHPGVLGQPLPQAFPHEFAKVAGFYDRVFAGEGVHVPAQRLDPGGTGTQDVFDAYLTPVRNEAGDVIAAAMTGVAASDRERAEAALRESEARYRTLFETMGQGYSLTEVVRDADGRAIDLRYLELNPSFERLTGVSVSQARGRLASEVFPGLDRFWIDIVDRAVTGGVIERVEHEFAPVGRWYQSSFYPTGGDRCMLLYDDITERKQAEVALRESEARQAFSLRLTDALRPLADPIAAQDVAARMLGRELAVDRCYYAEFDWPGDVLFIHREYVRSAAVSAVGAHPISAFNDLLVHSHKGEPLVCDNIATHPIFHREIAAHRERGTDAFILVPLVKQGTMVACMGVTMEGPRHWSPAEIRLVEDVAERTWSAVERARAEAALRDSEARYQALFTASPMPFMVLGANPPDFTILAANDAYVAATLTTRRTLIGKRLFDVFTDDPARPGPLGSEALNASLRRVLSTRLTDAMERVRYDIRTPGGTFEQHWWLAINAPLLDAAGNVSAIIHQVDQQTELHQAERALHGHEERQAFLLALSDALRARLDPVDIQEEATTRLGRRLGVDRAVYAEFVEEDGQDYVVIEREYRTAGTPSFAGRHGLERFGSDGPDLKAGRVVAVEDVEREPVSDEQRAVWRAIGVRARLAVPLMKGDRPVVSLGVQSAAPRAWSQDDIALVREVGERTWEAVQRARAEGALRESETRLRQFGEASHDVLWIRDAQKLQWQYLTPAFESIYGLKRAEALAGNNYRSWLDLVLPEDRERATASIRRVRNGEHVTFDYRIRRPIDGTIRWLRNTDFPIADETGAVALIGGIGHDLTELREAELRLQTLIDGIPQLVWRAVDGGDWTWASPQWTTFTGQSGTDSLGQGWLEALHPDDRAVAMKAWGRAVETGGFEVEYRLRHAAEHDYRWFQTRATLVRGEAGEIIEWLGTSTDIHDSRELQERQQVLVAELQHRTRNLMAVVRATAIRSGEASVDLADFQHRFHDRLEALARVQGLLSRLNETDRVAFDELIGSELAAMGAGAARVTLEGPHGIRLRSSLVQTLAMALHELATNAVKYGALGQPQAHLSVKWRMDAADRRGSPLLHIDWRESSVVMPAGGSAPQGGGHGRELIEEALPYQLDADTRFELGPDGVHCTITIPVSVSNTAEPAHA